MRKLLFSVVFLNSITFVGQFGVSHRLNPEYSYAWNDVVPIDLDNDGDLDVPSPLGNTGEIGFVENIGNERFVVRELGYYPEFSNTNGYVTSTFFAKVDEDELYDIVIDRLYEENKIYVIFQYAPLQLAEPIVLPEFEFFAYGIESIVDTDGDNIQEWIIYDNSEAHIMYHFTNGVLESTGASVFVNSTFERWDTTNRIADMDSDGDFDILDRPAITINSLDGLLSEINLGWYENEAGQYISVNYISIDVSEFGWENFFEDPDWAVFDADGDLDQDVIIAYRNYLFVCSNQGNNNFDITYFEMDIFSTELEVGDFDQNGFTDVVLMDYSANIRTYLNVGFGEFSSVSSNLGVPASYRLFAPSDLNGDGLLDLLFSSEFFDSTLGIFWNLGQGQFSEIQLIDGIITGGFQMVADTNNDSAIEYYFHTHLEIYSSYCGGILMVEYDKNTQKSSKEVLHSEVELYYDSINRFVDVDNDSDLDIIFQTGSGDGDVSEWWLESLGDGTYNDTHLLPFVNDIHTPFLIWDINGDSKNDFLVFNINGGVFSWFVNDGNDSFVFYDLYPLASNQNDLDWIDYNLDGKIDLHWSDENTGDHFISLNNGVNFTDLLISHPECDMEFVGDMDGNGFLDAIVLQCGLQPQYCFFNESGEYTTLIVPHENELYEFSTVIDFDVDGDWDFLTNEYFYENEGNTSFSPPSEICLGLNMYCGIEYLSDLDTDGDPDNLLYLGVWTENMAISEFSISGMCFVDINENGLHDDGEDMLSSYPIAVEPEIVYAYTDANGNFVLYPESEGEHIISAEPTEYWQNSTPSAITVSITNDVPQIDGLLFGFVPLIDTLSFETNFVSTMPLCSSFSHQWYHIENNGTKSFSALVTLIWDSLYTSSMMQSVPDSIWDYSSYFSIDDINPFDDFYLEWYLQSPNFNFMGDTLKSFVRTDIFDENGFFVSSVTDTICQVLLCSYDPNDKQVSPQGWTDEGYILNEESLEYTVRFQNTGNYYATDVRIEDQLSENLDWSSLEFVASSHTLTNMYIEESGMAHFEFENIMLPDSSANFEESNGFVKYRINLLPGLEPLSTIENTAYIYFDQNPEVITNTTLNTLFDCAMMEYNVLMEAMVCEGDVFEYNPEVQYADTYQWYVDGVYYGNESAISFSAATVGVYDIQLVASNDLCQLEVNIPLSVSPTPDAPELIQDGNTVVSDVSGGLMWYFNDEFQSDVFGSVFEPGEDGWVSVVYFDGVCASAMSDVIFFNYTVINEYDKSGITLTPNPADSYVMVSATQFFQGSAYRLIDGYGREVLEGILEGEFTYLDIRSLSGGIYSLLIEGQRNVLILVVE